MSFINYSSREINCKIVYYGPGLCGKTTNLHFIYGHTTSDSRGEMVSLETETDRTLFFDLLGLEPLDRQSVRYRDPEQIDRPPRQQQSTGAAEQSMEIVRVDDQILEIRQS